LPSVFVSSLWKNLRYRDLHPEIFEPKTVETNKTSLHQASAEPVNPCKTPTSKLESQEQSYSTEKLHSATKKLNKAVGNIISSRTPSKIPLDSDYLLNLDLGENDVTRELISSILSDENFTAVLNSADSTRDSDVTLIKTWFNQVNLFFTDSDKQTNILLTS